MAKDGTNRGGARIGSGQKKKPLADKIAHNESTDIYILIIFRDIQIIYFWYLSFRR